MRKEPERVTNKIEIETTVITRISQEFQLANLIEEFRARIEGLGLKILSYSVPKMRKTND